MRWRFLLLFSLLTFTSSNSLATDCAIWSDVSIEEREACNPELKDLKYIDAKILGVNVRTYETPQGVELSDGIWLSYTNQTKGKSCSYSTPRATYWFGLKASYYQGTKYGSFTGQEVVSMYSLSNHHETPEGYVLYAEKPHGKFHPGKSTRFSWKKSRSHPVLNCIDDLENLLEMGKFLWRHNAFRLID